MAAEAPPVITSSFSGLGCRRRGERARAYSSQRQSRPERRAASARSSELESHKERAANLKGEKVGRGTLLPRRRCDGARGAVTIAFRNELVEPVVLARDRADATWWSAGLASRIAPGETSRTLPLRQSGTIGTTRTGMPRANGALRSVIIDRARRSRSASTASTSCCYGMADHDPPLCTLLNAH